MNSFKKFYTGQNYNQHMYNGLIGFFMKLSHKKMEKNKEKKSKVLEIGPGTHPHTDYLLHEFDEYHVAEKIEELSEMLQDIYFKLKPGGNLTIALPTDPGLMWRAGKFISANFLIKKSYDFTKEDYYYFTAKDHVNSIFSLIPIIKKNFNKINFERFEPFKIPLLDCNLFYIIDIEK